MARYFEIAGFSAFRRFGLKAVVLIPRQLGKIFRPNVDRNGSQKHDNADPEQQRKMNLPRVGLLCGLAFMS
jgi:hypothetical protein